MQVGSATASMATGGAAPGDPTTMLTPPAKDDRSHGVTAVGVGGRTITSHESSAFLSPPGDLHQVEHAIHVAGRDQVFDATHWAARVVLP